MNQVILIGILTKDPETRYTTGGSQTAVCRFTVAVNDRRKNAAGAWEDAPSFIPIVVFGKQAKTCDRFLAKGRKVAVSGRIQTGSYTNREGQKVYTTDVIANNVEFLSSRGEDTRTTENRQMPTQQEVLAPEPLEQEEMPGFGPWTDDDIPF